MAKVLLMVALLVLQASFSGAQNCRQGPCNSTGGGGGSLAGVEGFFNSIKNRSKPSCPGRNFYTYSAFQTAALAYPRFGTTGSQDVQKREICALLAHIIYQTGSFCYIEEINGATMRLCDPSNRQWPCNPSKSYYGRGPIMISWNFNYGPAGQSIGFDGLNAPETVANDPVISFKTAFWFWMNKVHSIITSGQGFGPTIRAFSGGLECDGRNPSAVNARVGYYTDCCQRLGVSPGANLYC